MQGGQGGQRRKKEICSEKKVDLIIEEEKTQEIKESFSRAKTTALESKLKKPEPTKIEQVNNLNLILHQMSLLDDENFQ